MNEASEFKQILDEQLASGEITPERYDEILKRLSASSSGSAASSASSETGANADDVPLGVTLDQDGRSRDLPPLPAGALLADRFELSEELGRGGYGAVYLAKDLKRRSKYVAVKITLPKEGESDHLQNDLTHELERHELIHDMSHVVRSHDVHQADLDGLPLVLLSMEYADGGNLRSWLDTNHEPEDRHRDGLALFKQCCRGVQAIHDAGMIHMDLKPENVLLMDGKAKIADFGLGRLVGMRFGENPEYLLRQGIGTPRYMSPEQFHTTRQKDIDHRSDIYSLGLLLYEVVDGGLPFDGSAKELREKHLHMEPKPPAGEAKRWWRIIARCLQKDPSKRYENIASLLTDIERVEQGLSVSADVSCPECGHINLNSQHTLCERCRGDVSAHFRACPRCAREVRRDIELCPGCGERVMAYYTLHERWKLVDNLKDEDPVRAIELLEIILREGAGEFQDRSITLIRELRDKQATISKLIVQADRMLANGEPQKSIDTWNRVLDVVPRHRIATERINELEDAIRKVKSIIETAQGELKLAYYSEAESRLVEALEIIPSDKGAVDILQECRRRADRYRKAMNDARHAQQHRELETAKSHAKRALGVAPDASEVKNLLQSIEQEREKAQSLFAGAEEHIRRARFESAAESIEECERIQQDIAGAPQLKGSLTRKRNNYTVAMEEAAQAVERHDLDDALRRIASALRSCPDSEDAAKLHSVVEERQQRALELFRRATDEFEAACLDAALEHVHDIDSLWRLTPGFPELKTRLLKTRDAYDKAVSRARQLRKQLKLSEAQQCVNEALRIRPDSEDAAFLRASIEKELKRAASLFEQAENQMLSAEFDAAAQSIDELESVQRDMNNVPQLKGTLTRKRRIYSTAMDGVEDALRRHDLDGANDCVESALKVCPNSDAASHRREEIRNIPKRTSQMLQDATEAVRKADFDHAESMINGISSLWHAAPGFLEFEHQYKELYRDYIQNLYDAKEAKHRCRMALALSYIQKALSICPQSTEAEKIQVAIESAHDKAIKLIRMAKDLIRKGDFDDALVQLRNAEKVWVDAPSLNETRRHLVKIRTRYEEHLSVAFQAEQERDLHSAREHFQRAAKVCELAETPAIGIKRIVDAKAEARKYVDMASKQRVAAQFDDARQYLKQANSIWPTYRRIEREAVDLNRIKKEFKTSIGRAEALLSQQQYVSAIAQCDIALTHCPASTIAKNLRDKIKIKHKQFEEQAYNIAQRFVRLIIMTGVITVATVAVIAALGGRYRFTIVMLSILVVATVSMWSFRVELKPHAKRVVHLCKQVLADRPR